MQSLDHEAFVYLTRDEAVGHRIRVLMAAKLLWQTLIISRWMA